jgi:hypothetical protein
VNEDIAELVRQGIDRLPADVTAPARLAAQARRHNRRRRSALALTVAAGTAGVASAAVLVATGNGAGARAPDQAWLTAYVAGRMEKALSPASLADMVSVTTVQAAAIPLPGGMTTVNPLTVSWSYRNLSRDEYFGKTGQPAVDVGDNWGTMRPGGTDRETTVDYVRGTWSRVSYPIEGPGPGMITPASSGCASQKTPVGYVGMPLPFFQPTPGYVKATVACGALAADGHAVVDGVDTIKLVGTAKSKARPLTVYVDPATYLPLRVVELGQQTDYQWLQATPANIAQLRVPVPAGFRRTAQPPQSLVNDEGFTDYKTK